MTSSFEARFNQELGLPSDLLIIDADTHRTEPADLWTARAPAKYKDRMPRVENVEGKDTWMFDGVRMAIAGTSSVIMRDGEKKRGMDFVGAGYENIHQGAFDIPPRLEFMDEQGIWAQIVYPNTFGFGGQKFVEIDDEDLRVAAVQVYNDASADMQRESSERMFGMAVLPWWDVDASVAEIRRSADMGLRGINLGTGPHTFGLPDLGESYWDPMWDVCAELNMPVNFHIGAGNETMSWFGSSPWPSHDWDHKLAIGSAMMYLSNAAVMGNLIFSGVLERHPNVKFVSVESGVGWIPFFLQSLDYQKIESTPKSTLSLTPTEYFQRQMYACFWFEDKGVTEAMNVLGDDRLLFETDFPHPTCLYPDSLSMASATLQAMPEASRRKVMSDNSAALYNIPLPVPAT